METLVTPQAIRGALWAVLIVACGQIAEGDFRSACVLLAAVVVLQEVTR